MADKPDAPNSNAASSPSSTANQNADGLKAAKDRKCPFCSQAFTSSSLGRHLDLYIKPKNPKPPDGVHDVDQIKELRGNITRRQPRTSLKAASNTRRESSGTPGHIGSAARPAPSIQSNATHHQRYTEGSPIASPAHTREGESPKMSFNAGSWHSTGVINNIPPRAPSRSNGATPSSGQAQRIQEMRRDTSGQRILRPDEADNTYKSLQEQAEIGRAAEMALREVLGSVQAARRKGSPVQMYPDIDFFALPFPGLCLAILPAPPTLSSPAPFATAESWTLEPPGRKQFEVVSRLIQERGRELRAADPDGLTDSTWFRTTAHLQGAFQNWQLMSDSDKSTAWTLSILRAYDASQNRSQSLVHELETLKQHAANLEVQFDRLSRCQLPREFLSRMPNTMPLSNPVVTEMRRHANTHNPRSPVLEADYDADALLSKWREVVRAVARPVRHPAPTPTYADSITSSRSRPSGNGAGNSTGVTGPNTGNQALEADMIGNGAVWAVNGPIPMGTDCLGQNEPQRALVSYETPPEPGTVVEEEGEGSGRGWREEGEGYPDVSSVLDSSLTGFVDRNALAKQRRFVRGVNGEKRGAEGGEGGSERKRFREGGE